MFKGRRKKQGRGREGRQRERMVTEQEKAVGKLSKKKEQVALLSFVGGYWFCFTVINTVLVMLGKPHDSSFCSSA